MKKNNEFDIIFCVIGFLFSFMLCIKCPYRNICIYYKKKKYIPDI